MIINKFKNLKSTKKTKINFYKKIFKFKIFFFNLNLKNNNGLYLNYLKIFKILLYVNDFGVFINDNFKINNSWIFSFWKKGFISNFWKLKWYFINFFLRKKLPAIIINLTLNESISIEALNKNIPLITFFKTHSFAYSSNTNLADYFFSQKKNLKNLDTIFFLINLLSFLKKYKNV